MSGLFDYGMRWREPASNQPYEPKSQGFMGELPVADGSKATEYSIDVGINGKNVQIPTIVPTLTKQELRNLLDIVAAGGSIPDSIIEKAVNHARQRLAQGKSPFWSIPEKQVSPSNLPSIFTTGLESEFK